MASSPSPKTTTNAPNSVRVKTKTEAQRRSRQLHRTMSRTLSLALDCFCFWNVAVAMARWQWRWRGRPRWLAYLAAYKAWVVSTAAVDHRSDGGRRWFWKMPTRYFGNVPCSQLWAERPEQPSPSLRHDATIAFFVRVRPPCRSSAAPPPELRKAIVVTLHSPPTCELNSRRRRTLWRLAPEAGNLFLLRSPPAAFLPSKHLISMGLEIWKMEVELILML
uniref:Uncharacterized protein n=1 Tax=Oryza meridionalis TaxID=40149 RepID=A0A0E0DFF8_9ORYZ